MGQMLAGNKGTCLALKDQLCEHSSAPGSRGNAAGGEALRRVVSAGTRQPLRAGGAVRVCVGEASLTSLPAAKQGTRMG